MSTAAKPKKFKRTQTLVEPRFQIGLACAVTMMFLGVAAIYMVGGKLLFSERVVSSMSPKAHQLIVTCMEMAYFLGIVFLVHAVVVRVTLRVAGPALVVARGLRRMTKGDYSSRLSLRDGDFLNPVADAAAELEEKLRVSEETVAAALVTLRSADASDGERAAAVDAIEAAVIVKAQSEESSGDEEAAEPEDCSDEARAAA